MVALVIILALFIVYLLFLWKARKIEPIKYRTVSAGDPNKDFSSTIALNTNIYNFNIYSKKNEKINDVEMNIIDIRVFRNPFFNLS